MVYSVSYKEEKECPGYSNVVSGTGDIVREDNQEASFKGNFQHAVTLVMVCLGPYNPVGRNKLLKKSKRGQKNTRATYYYQSDSIKKKLFIRKKETATSSVTKASAKEPALRESHRMD